MLAVLLFCLSSLPTLMIAQTFPCEHEFVLPGPTLPAPVTIPADTIKENRWGLNVARGPGPVRRFPPGSSLNMPPLPSPKGMPTAATWSDGGRENDEDSHNFFLPNGLRDQKRISFSSGSLAPGGHWQAASAFGLKAGATMVAPSSYDVSSLCCTQGSGRLTRALNRPNAGTWAFVASPHFGIRQAPAFQLPRSQTVAPSRDPVAPLATPKSVADDILHDQKRIWVFPWDVVGHGRHWEPALAFTLATSRTLHFLASGSVVGQTLENPSADADGLSSCSAR